MPLKDPETLRTILYTLTGFIGAFASIVYGLIIGRKTTILTSLGMIFIGGLIGWIAGSVTDSTVVASVAGVLSMEIMHGVKEIGPSVIKEAIKRKIDNFFN